MVNDQEQMRRDCEAFYWIAYAIDVGHAGWQAQKAKLIKARGESAVKILISDMERLRHDVRTID